MTVLKYEKGQVSDKIQPRSLAGLDGALQWRPGSAEGLLFEGLEPRPMVEIDNSSDTAVLESMAERMRSYLDAITLMRGQIEELTDEPELQIRSVSLQAEMAMNLLELQRHLDERRRKDSD